MTGSAGAVEPGVTVQVTNVSASERTGTQVRVSVPATQTGSFQLLIPAQIGDRIEIIAVRAASESPRVETTAGPSVTSVQLRIVAGDQQVGVVTRTLTDSFRVQATIPAGPVQSLAIVFESETAGGVFSRNRVVTDNNGNAASTYTLGAAEGPYAFVARLELAAATVVRATALAVGAPQIVSIVPAVMAFGDTVTVNGANFSPRAEHNVVRFGTERGTVVSASSTSLRVVVPLFAAGDVSVTLTGVSSNVVNAVITPPVVEGRALGDVRLESLPPAGTGNVLLPFEDATQEFTLVIQSLVPSSTFSSVSVQGASGVELRALAPGAAAPAPVSGESYIRRLERELLRRLPPPQAAAAPPRALAPAQDLGSTREFWVINKATAVFLNDPTAFDRVTATLRFKGDNTLVYVDNRALLMLSDGQIDQIGARFDQHTYPVDVGTFGAPSDIDGNGRVMILLSPTVNALTTPDIMAQNARIVGFFFGPDLVPSPSNPHANAGEVFYAVVPNPSGEFPGASVSQAEIVDLLGSVFAHEFQHMISFNEKFLLRGVSSEALWLDEGLAHMAESLNGFPVQNRLRSAFFLDGPPDVTLVAGGNGLDERGAAWLFVQYLVDHFGQEILGRLVQSSLTSTTNVSVAAGVPFATLFHRWVSTLLLDGPEVPNDPMFELPSIDLRGDFELSKTQLNRNTPQIGDAYLAPATVSAPGGVLGFQQKGTSPAYVFVTTRGRANVPITITGLPSAQLQVAIIRTR